MKSQDLLKSLDLYPTVKPEARRRPRWTDPTAGARKIFRPIHAEAHHPK